MVNVSFETIEKYIYGELKGKELKDFEKILDSMNKIKNYPVNLFTYKDCIGLYKKGKKKKDKKI